MPKSVNRIETNSDDEGPKKIKKFPHALKRRKPDSRIWKLLEINLKFYSLIHSSFSANALM